MLASWQWEFTGMITAPIMLEKGSGLGFFFYSALHVSMSLFSLWCGWRSSLLSSKLNVLLFVCVCISLNMSQNANLPYKHSLLGKNPKFVFFGFFLNYMKPKWCRNFKRWLFYFGFQRKACWIESWRERIELKVVILYILCYYIY